MLQWFNFKIIILCTIYTGSLNSIFLIFERNSAGFNKFDSKSCFVGLISDTHG